MQRAASFRAPAEPQNQGHLSQAATVWVAMAYAITPVIMWAKLRNRHGQAFWCVSVNMVSHGMHQRRCERVRSFITVLLFLCPSFPLPLRIRETCCSVCNQLSSSSTNNASGRRNGCCCGTLWKGKTLCQEHLHKAVHTQCNRTYTRLQVHIMTSINIHTSTACAETRFEAPHLARGAGTK